METPIALTIAGSDSSGGAGIQADLKTFSRLKVYGLSVITAITAQNTQGLLGIYDIPDEFVRRQLEAVLADTTPRALKTGMLSHGGIVEAVAWAIRQYSASQVVVDPVLASSSGTPLFRDSDIDTLKRLLFPLATIVTPNLAEAEILTRRPVADIQGMEEAARRLHETGAQHVLIKGGHLPEEPIDVFFDGSAITHLPGSRVAVKNTHGTGCVLSAAITAYLAHGRTIHDAVSLAKEFITEAIRGSRTIGRGAPVLPV